MNINQDLAVRGANTQIFRESLRLLLGRLQDDLRGIRGTSASADGVRSAVIAFLYDSIRRGVIKPPSFWLSPSDIITSFVGDKVTVSWSPRLEDALAELDAVDRPAEPARADPNFGAALSRAQLFVANCLAPGARPASSREVQAEELKNVREVLALVAEKQAQGFAAAGVSGPAAGVSGPMQVTPSTAMQWGDAKKLVGFAKAGGASLPDLESDVNAVQYFRASHAELEDSAKEILTSLMTSQPLPAAKLENLLSKLKLFFKASDPDKGWLVFYRNRDKLKPMTVSAMGASPIKQVVETTPKKKVDEKFVDDLSRLLIALRDAWQQYENSFADTVQARRKNEQASSRRDNATDAVSYAQATIDAIDVMKAGLDSDGKRVWAERRMLGIIKDLMERTAAATKLSGGLQQAITQTLEQPVQDTPLGAAMDLADESSRIAQARRRVAGIDSIGPGWRGPGE